MFEASQTFDVGIEQFVQMHDKISHMGVVDGGMSLRLPGGQSAVIVGVNAYEIELAEISKRHPVEILKFAAKHQMQQLLGLDVFF